MIYIYIRFTFTRIVISYKLCNITCNILTWDILHTYYATEVLGITTRRTACTLYSVLHCILYSVLCTTLYNVQCTVHGGGVSS